MSSGHVMTRRERLRGLMDELAGARVAEGSPAL
jgi:hypothetical protein